MSDNFDIYLCMDGPANREAAARVLRQAKLAFRSFDSGRELIRAVQADNIGVLLLEQTCMRWCFEALHSFLTAQPRWSEIPVILATDKMSAGTAQILVEKVPNLTMLEKPVSSASLLSHLRAAQQSRRRQYQLRNLLSEFSRLNENLEEQVARRSAEAERRRVEAERSNEDLQLFASMVSHDLREPLLVISRYMNLLEKQFGEVLDDSGNRFVKHSIASAKRMQNMISSILKYSRSEKAILNMERIDSKKLVEQVCANLELRITAAKAVVSMDDAMPMVYGDRVQLGQLFQNLISNGIKFAHLEAPRIHISAEKGESVYRFAVADNGIGISPEQYQQIFEIFNRAGLQEKFPGSGVGLAVCKKIVERHGGTIWVESKLWDGSTFYFTLPDESKAAT